MLCRGQDVTLYNLNGDFILEQLVCVEGDELVTSCAFYEGNGSEYLQRNLIFTGHRRGVVNVGEARICLCLWLAQLTQTQIWDLTVLNGRFVLEHIKRLHHMDGAGFNVNASVTCILPLAQVVYTGDDDGRVVCLTISVVVEESCCTNSLQYEWDCIQRQ